MEARVHVDYLSHDWLANDVICAHAQIKKQVRMMTAKLSTDPDNKSLRLEHQRLSRFQNALWRQMGRTCTVVLGRHNPLVHPSSVNWQKESDITWLYGPLYANEDKDEISSTPTQPHDGLKPVLKSSIYVRQRDDERAPSFSSIASTSSSTSSILPPPTPINGVRFSPESAKIQYFIPESPAREFLTTDADWNPYWSYDEDQDDDDDADDDLWELMVGVTSRVKDWFSPRRKEAHSTGLLDLVFTLISVGKSVASLMATWVVYQGLVRMLWIVRRPAIRQRRSSKEPIDYL